MRLAVFDVDGTLVDSQHSIVAAMQAAFAAHGEGEPKPQEVRGVVGLPLMDSVARLLPGAGVAVHDRITGAYRDAYGDLRRLGEVQEPLFPGASECLQALEDLGWLLGVATGKSRRGLIWTLERHGLVKRFATLQSSDMAKGKPHPEMLLRAISETGAEARTTAMIGDTSFDMEMARNAGTLAIGVAWGYHDSNELRDSGAHVIVESFADLPGALEKLVPPVEA